MLFAALRSPLKDDIAWLLYVAHRWMSGRELYVDVIEVNPPLIIWISAIPLAVARWLGRYAAIRRHAGLRFDRTGQRMVERLSAAADRRAVCAARSRCLPSSAACC